MIEKRYLKYPILKIECTSKFQSSFWNVVILKSSISIKLFYGSFSVSQF